ncbi:MAG: D-alanine--D-alanine ligase family protein [Spirochaetota bacterium]
MSVGIIYGGKSGEHEVSLHSAYSILKNLSTKDYSAVAIGIDKKGVWYLQSKIEMKNETLKIIRESQQTVAAVPGKGLYVDKRRIKVDIVFPVLHGTFGEDGTIQGLLELADIPYVGAGVLGSALSMDKDKAKRVWKEAGLPVVPYILLRKAEFASPHFSLKKFASSALIQFGLPLFIKPSCAGSSLGVSKIGNAGEMEEALALAFTFDTKVLVEPCVNGREIECSVTGNGDPVAYGPGEIVPHHSFYDYEAKYIDPNGAELLLPAKLTKNQAGKLKDIAVKAYKLAEVEGMARVDFFQEKEKGKILLSEINTIPGFTNISMFPKMCEAGGLYYPELLDLLIKHGLERYRERKSLRYTYQ